MNRRMNILLYFCCCCRVRERSFPSLLKSYAYPWWLLSDFWNAIHLFCGVASWTGAISNPGSHHDANSFICTMQWLGLADNRRWNTSNDVVVYKNICTVFENDSEKKNYLVKEYWSVSATPITWTNKCVLGVDVLYRIDYALIYIIIIVIIIFQCYTCMHMFIHAETEEYCEKKN